MPAAARVGDLTNHGTPLGPGPGSPNVLIGGMPAWRVGMDSHVCPVLEGQKVHGAGIVMSGSKRVFINKLAAVRQGDKFTEVGASGPNEITAGCDRVQIGG